MLYCLDLYQRRSPTDRPAVLSDVTTTIAGHLRKTSLVPVISDFLFADAARVIKELSLLNAAHDLFLMLVDARFAYQLPTVSAGCSKPTYRNGPQARDVAQGVQPGWPAASKSGRRRHAALGAMPISISGAWDDRWEMETTLVEFVAERRLRKP